MTGPRVLFISHEASRTGAPIVLLHFLRWLRAHATLDFEILLAEDGPLRGEFERLAPVSVLPSWTDGMTPGQLLARLRRRLALSRAGTTRWDAVYSNTVANGWVLDALQFHSAPVISHIHELESVIDYYGAANLSKVKRHTRQYVACAQAVKDNLVHRHGIPPAVIEGVHEFIPVPPGIDARSADVTAPIRAELGLPPDALVVGAAGSPDWRKGVDLFIHLAHAVRSRRPDLPTHFVWVGGDPSGRDREDRIQHDIRSLDLQGRTHFVGSRGAPLDWFALFDVFALTSREDPFPLVCLEAASLGKPIVCFDGAGGEKEFVEDDCGYVVPHLDIDVMADRIVMLLESAELRQQCGRRAAHKVRARHDVAIVAPRLLALITDQITAMTPSPQLRRRPRIARQAR
jgi:glycosyltransferase involved in cell wall biosynthesis